MDLKTDLPTAISNRPFRDKPLMWQAARRDVLYIYIYTCIFERLRQIVRAWRIGLLVKSFIFHTRSLRGRELFDCDLQQWHSATFFVLPFSCFISVCPLFFFFFFFPGSTRLFHLRRVKSNIYKPANFDRKSSHHHCLASFFSCSGVHIHFIWFCCR